MPKPKKIPGERKLAGGSTLYNERVKISGSKDPKTYEFLTNSECIKCGVKNELREEVPNAKKRAAFKEAAKSHNCEADTIKSRQFINASREYEMGRKDLNG